MPTGRFGVPSAWPTAAPNARTRFASASPRWMPSAISWWVHDAARPFISPDVIHASIRVASQAGAALVAVPAADTLKRVEQVDADTPLNKKSSVISPARTVVETLSRQDVWLAQTPQTFRVPLIRAAHQRALDEAIQVTDDAALIEKFGGTVQIVPGERRNFKITTPDDLRMAEALLSAHASER